MSGSIEVMWRKKGLAKEGVGNGNLNRKTAYGREPFSDETSNYSAESSNSKSSRTSNATYKVKKGLTKQSRKGSFTNSQAWSKALPTIKESLPTIKESESACSGMSGVISSHSGHTNKGGKGCSADFEFEDDTMRYSQSDDGADTNYNTEYTTGGMTAMTGMTGLTNFSRMSEINEEDESEYGGTNYTQLTDCTTGSAYGTEYGTEYTGITEYTAVTDNGTEYGTEYTGITEYTEDDSAYTGYTTAYTQQMLNGTKSDLSRLGSSTAMSYEEGEFFPGDPCDLRFLRGELKDLLRKGKRGIVDMVGCNAIANETARKQPRDPPKRSYEYVNMSAQTQTKTQQAKAHRRNPSEGSASSKQSKQSLNDCLI